jgi:ribulose-phosphate 3-epimerase
VKDTVKIAASVMCANLLRLEEAIRELDRVGVDFFHIDIMDGHFVPNLALNFDFIEQIRAVSRTPLDVHLMVEAPESLISTLESLRVECVSFHVEAAKRPLSLIQEVKGRGMKAGVALKPSTGISALEYLLEDVDYILVMTVEPGFARQKFISTMLDKISSLRRSMSDHNVDIPIEVDGNISIETARWCLERGASILVGGTSSIFRKETGIGSACVAFKRAIGID